MIAGVADEKEIVEQMAIEVSNLDAQRDLRILRVIPKTAVELEAAFRQHRNDVCEQLPAGESLRFTDYTLALTPRDQYRTKQQVYPSTRRQFLTVGL